MPCSRLDLALQPCTDLVLFITGTPWPWAHGEWIYSSLPKANRTPKKNQTVSNSPCKMPFHCGYLTFCIETTACSHSSPPPSATDVEERKSIRTWPTVVQHGSDRTWRKARNRQQECTFSRGKKEKVGEEREEVQGRGKGPLLSGTLMSRSHTSYAAFPLRA